MWMLICVSKYFKVVCRYSDRRVTSEDQIPVLVYKFDNKPIRIRVQAKVLNPVLDNKDKLLDLNWDSFIYLLRTLYNEDLEEHDK